MFAKRARSQYFTRDFRLGLGRSAVTIRACNDNQPVRQSSRSRSLRAPGLLCLWPQTPAGRLECHWHTDTAAPDSSEGDIGLLGHQRAVTRHVASAAA